jgi:hypothetical protein
VSTLRPHLLARLEARHDYFADGWCRSMRFEPINDCGEWLAGYQLMARADDRSLTLHAPEHRLRDLWEACLASAAPPKLEFRVRCADPGFGWYTDRVLPRVARIDLGDSPDHATWLAGLGRTIVQQWHGRSSIWCYWLLGDWHENVLSIVDTRGKREFDALGRRMLDPARGIEAHCFRSHEPLSLSEGAASGLQLRAGDSAASTRIVVSQLPAPKPSALQFEDGPDGRQTVSEIFVNR